MRLKKKFNRVGIRADLSFSCFSCPNMSVSYKKLWKLLIDKDMKKKDLCEKAGISPASVTKMGRNGHVTTEILMKICAALDCRIEDIVEVVPDNKKNI